MRVAVVGAGSLGRVFGVRLAGAGVDVDFVVRPEHARAPSLRVEPVLRGEASTLAAPSYVTEVPAHADVALLCVRGDQLGDDLLGALPDVPVVTLAPMLPKTCARVRRRLGERLVVGLSGIGGYENRDGVVRYWQPRTVQTLLEEPRASSPAPNAVIAELVAALGRTGVGVGVAKGVDEASAATVLAFLPLVLGLDAGGSIDAWLGDRGLLGMTFDAAREARALADRCGALPYWADWALRFLGRRTVRIGVALGRSRAPEALAFVEARFGRAIRGQNVLMAEEACDLAAEKGVGHAALGELLARVRASPA